jgi:hypothetical protein
MAGFACKKHDLLAYVAAAPQNPKLKYQEISQVRMLSRYAMCALIPYHSQGVRRSKPMVKAMQFCDCRSVAKGL